MCLLCACLVLCACVLVFAFGCLISARLSDVVVLFGVLALLVCVGQCVVVCCVFVAVCFCVVCCVSALLFG